MFDVLTIAAITDELSATLLDGRVQRVGLVGPLTLAAEIYAGGQRHYLLASAETQDARLHLTTTMPSLDPALRTPFGLLLRKYTRGGVIVGVEQPPLERLVRVSIAKRLGPHNGPRPQSDELLLAVPDQVVTDDQAEDEDSDGEGERDATYVHLTIEIMGRHSNIVLIHDDGRIMESVKRVTPSMSRVRPILPRLPYTPPPPVLKADPRRLTAAEATTILSSEQPQTALASALIRRFRAVSPAMAREVAYRTAGDAAVTIGDLPAAAAAVLARETRALLEPLLTSVWAPRVYREQGDEVGDGAVVAFAPIPMRHLAATYRQEMVRSISAAAELARDDDSGTGPQRHVQRRERLARSIRQARERVHGRLASLREQQKKAAAADELRQWGELIYGYLWQIVPGQTTLDVDGTAVPLDAGLSAKENAQAYFEQYRKARSASEQVPQLVAHADAEVAYLDQLLTMVAQAEGFAEIETLTAEWESRHPGAATAPQRRSPSKRPAAKRPRPLLDTDGNAVYIGRTGSQNDVVTFDLAGPDDSWLHARGVPGSHVIIRWRHGAAEDGPDTIAAAAALAAYYSAARTSASVEVDITRRRHVRKIKGAGPGMVTYRQERTIAVRPADEVAVKDVLALPDPNRGGEDIG